MHAIDEEAAVFEKGEDADGNGHANGAKDAFSPRVLRLGNSDSAEVSDRTVEAEEPKIAEVKALIIRRVWIPPCVKNDTGDEEEPVAQSQPAEPYDGEDDGQEEDEIYGVEEHLSAWATVG